MIMAAKKNSNPRLRICMLCYEATCSTGYVWTVKYGTNAEQTAKYVVVGIPMTTVFRGPKARQPRAYLRGRGYVLPLPDGGLLLTDGSSWPGVPSTAQPSRRK